MSAFQSIDEVLKAYPSLGQDGFRIPGGAHYQITAKGDGEAIELSRVWIRFNLETTLKPGRAKWRSSYELKRMVEADYRGVYVSNGAFIVAMILEEYGIQRFDPWVSNGEFFVAFRKDAAK